MEKFKRERGDKRADYLPQSEEEWLKTGKFKIEEIAVEGRDIRCALVRGPEHSPLVTMVRGIPRDLERRKKLPLINKLYGYLAIKMLDRGESSLLYNQPATGGSTGEWEKETFQSRTEVLVEASRQFLNRLESSNLSLIGTSAGAYMAINALRPLENLGIKVPKLVLLSPAAFPKDIENIPYGATFSKIIREDWDVATSPAFSVLERYARNGGSIFMSFFEADNPPIPEHIQDFYRDFAQRLSGEGADITYASIPDVAHNFRRIGVPERANAVDNERIRETAIKLADFLQQ
ncbi:MAG: alpha/beta hydrolase [bacterium]|nr:alpha/beta hydrolase [bacterium]